MELKLDIVSSATTGNTEKVFAERNDHFRLKKNQVKEVDMKKLIAAM